MRTRDSTIVSITTNIPIDISNRINSYMNIRELSSMTQKQKIRIEEYPFDDSEDLRPSFKYISAEEHREAFGP